MLATALNKLFIVLLNNNHALQILKTLPSLIYKAVQLNTSAA